MTEKTCFHCGDEVIGKAVEFDEKSFCCSGCSTVYQILSDNKLGDFYAMESGAGIKPSAASNYKYGFLDVPEIRSKYITFENEESVHLTLFLPTIHCSSCIYLLENIHKIDPNVISCNVNFVQKTAAIVLKKEVLLSEFALLLDRIGYAPNFGDRKALESKRNFQYLYKLGVAGFAFGSIMLWTFPEYLGIDAVNPEIRSFTSYLSLIVSIPVLLYSASDYFISAFKALKFRSINLDVPISLGIIALYAQSLYTILVSEGTGYMDSFAGFVFFLLIGKWFQNKTYASLSFERDYTAYFPVAVTRMNGNDAEIVEIDSVQIGDILQVRNEEIIPCDAELLSTTIRIDYSFVTGESDPIALKKGDFIYAGGKVLGAPGLIKAAKESNRSNLTRMWNESDTSVQDLPNERLSRYFLIGVLVLALISTVVWSILDSSRVLEIVVAVLIVACPCALALSKPFTYGNIMRILGRKGLYLKDNAVIEKMNATTDFVFDKTGTLTVSENRDVHYSGTALTSEERSAIAVLTNASSHPISRAISVHLKEENIASTTIQTFEEIAGQGLIGTVGGLEIRIGNAPFVGGTNSTSETEAHIAINGNYKGKFTLHSTFRKGIFGMLKTVSTRGKVHILSGDSNKDNDVLLSEFPEAHEIRFRQTPSDKKEYIVALQAKNKKVLMIGDGLNDAGALKNAAVGIAISEDMFRFTPGSDAIIDAGALEKLPLLLEVAQFSKRILAVCYGFSLIYNVIGLTFALSGALTPLVAAILMPLSSITIVFMSTVGSQLKFRS